MINKKTFSEIMDLIKDFGGKYIVVNDGKPEFVIMDIEEYKKFIAAKKRIDELSEFELVEKVNQDIAKWKMVQDEKRMSQIEDGPVREDTSYYYNIDELE